MSKLRFATAREVFDAYPAAWDDIRAEPTEESPLTFMRRLVGSATPEDAVGFCAYMLSRREAVWWAHQCVQMLASGRAAADERALHMAEAWVRDPEEHRRRAALATGMEGNSGKPATWVALAAGWAGGSLVETEQGAVPTPSHLTAQAARVAVLTALAAVNPKERKEKLLSCIVSGERIAGAEAVKAH